VSKVLTVQYDRVIYLLEDTVANRSLIHCYLDVFEYPDGTHRDPGQRRCPALCPVRPALGY
jgi:hypothetical protein